MRLLTYNIHGCIGRDRRFDPERVSQVLRAADADVVALQEVESLAYGGADVLRYLARETGTTAIAGPTLRRLDADYGNALLTRLPVQHERQHDITVSPHEPRGVLEIELAHLGGLRIVTTHLGLRTAERRTQTRALLAQLDAGPPLPTVLLGDMNEWLPWSRSRRWLNRRFGQTPATASYPAYFPVLALDRIWLRGHRRVIRFGAISTALTRHASDHLPVFADVEW
jgi:endonuclease/exonuclease/phosphatase family metal-dependent hydrolase